jgi:hypothetical protein
MHRIVRYIRRHHIGLLALFIALGGVSYAATLPRNSVGSKQIRRNAVKASEIARKAVRTGEIRNNHVRKADIRTNAVGRSELRADAVSGDEVEDGSLAPADLAANSFLGPTIVARQSGNIPVPDNSTTTQSVACEAGATLIGGTAHLAGPVANGAGHADARITVSRPEVEGGGVPNTGAISGQAGPDGFTMWRGTVRNNAGGGGATEMRVWAFCAR